MKINLAKTIVLVGLVTCSALAQDFNPDAIPSGPPDKKKVSYALGMNLGLQLKRNNADVDPEVIAQAIKDVMEGKPTLIQESDIRPLFMQAQAYEKTKKIGPKLAEGKAFLAKNAKEPGIVVLPDGLQYRVNQAGTGETPTRTNVVTLKYSGAWIDGTEFKHKDRIALPFYSCPKGWQEALLLMKAGSKWTIYVPTEIGYNNPGHAAGEGSALIYELELIAVGPGDAPTENYGGGRLGHSLDEEFLPENKR